MIPEEEFLENATTLVRYAREELKQFLTWTDQRTAHRQQAGVLVQKLEAMVIEIKELRKTYKAR
jgi:hypothetical protein